MYQITRRHTPKAVILLHPLPYSVMLETGQQSEYMSSKYYTGIKALFIIPTDAHNYKITGMLKQLKFRQLFRHVSVHARTIIRELFRA